MTRTRQRKQRRAGGNRRVIGELLESYRRVIGELLSSLLYPVTRFLSGISHLLSCVFRSFL